MTVYANVVSLATKRKGCIMKRVEVVCPACGKVNPHALEEGAVEGPRAYHAYCWSAMSDAEQAEAWDREHMREAEIEAQRLRGRHDS